jgi:HlyD family secretion protein
MLKRLPLFLAIVAVLIGLIAYSQFRPAPNKVSGFIEADEIRLGSRVGGRVAQDGVRVQEGDRVRQGQVLIELEPFDLEELEREAAATLAAREADYQRLKAGLRPEEVAQAEARAKRLRARLELLRKGPRDQEIRAGRANKQVAEHALTLATQNYERVANLVKKGAGTQEELDRATESLRVAQSTLIVRDQELSLLEEGTRPEEVAEAAAQLEEAEEAWTLAKKGYRQEDIDAALAARDAAQAALAVLAVRKQELQIVAPVDGLVEALELRPGDLAPPGAPVLSVQDESRLWVRAYVPEDRLNLQLGQRLEIRIDSFPDDKFEGEVTFISPQAEFTPANVQTFEERVKQVFRIKVTFRISSPEERQKLKPGMAADVRLPPRTGSP